MGLKSDQIAAPSKASMKPMPDVTTHLLTTNPGKSQRIALLKRPKKSSLANILRISKCPR